MADNGQVYVGVRKLEVQNPYLIQKNLLIFVGQARQRVRRDGGIQPLEDRNGASRRPSARIV